MSSAIADDIINDNDDEKPEGGEKPKKNDKETNKDYPKKTCC